MFYDSNVTDPWPRDSGIRDSFFGSLYVHLPCPTRDNSFSNHPLPLSSNARKESRRLIVIRIDLQSFDKRRKTLEKLHKVFIMYIVVIIYSDITI